MTDYFKYTNLLQPPIRRAAYSDRTAWLMAEMSRIAYLKFENDRSILEAALSKAEFSLERVFNVLGTQAFLAKRQTDKIRVLSFRGTEKDQADDIISDLNARFYTDDKGAKIHDGFYQAYQRIDSEVRKAIQDNDDLVLYVTGHSLGGALAMAATKALNSDELAACYTFGSPRVGNDEFDDDIKPPIYRIVNAYDVVPFCPPRYFIDILSILPWKLLKKYLSKFRGYEHHGDMRYLTPVADDASEIKVICNPNELVLIYNLVKNREKAIKDHCIDDYCEKLAAWAIKRNNL